MPQFAHDARRYPRVKLKAFAEVAVESRADIYREYNASCINISEGGCCLEMQTVLSGVDIDFGVRVGIDLPDGQSRLIATGRVVWLKEEDGQKIVKYLVGIEFREINPQDKNRISRFVQSQIPNVK